MEADAGRLRYAGFLTMLIICALFLGARLIFAYVADPNRFPVNTIKIAATYQHISRKDIEGVLNRYLNTSFFLLPVGKLYADLAAFEWTSKVQIERIWPDTLKIKIKEKIPVAIWNDTMMTENGELFSKKTDLQDSSLPRLSGPLNQQAEVLQVFKKMSKILSIYRLQPASLAWRDNRAWELTLSNGVQLRLGKQDLETRITRFCRAYPAVFAEREEKLLSVDLRYPRGMAVQWQK